ncbi:phage portal protein [Carnobacterium maltaromaticum]|uniref:phage portal protein n=1 Tax=Carnobacterium maltaromaticum TaxID=2751 RepID=UPI0039AFAA80
MTSKVIESTKKNKELASVKKSEVTAGKNRPLKYKSLGGIEQSRDLTQLTPPYDLKTLRSIGESSSILKQCIDAYAHNVTGFGIGVRYKSENNEETAEMKAELAIQEKLMKELNFERPVKEVIEEVIHHVEECGNGYFEVIRNGKNEVVGLDSIKPEHMTATKLNAVTLPGGLVRKFRYYLFRDSLEDSGRKANGVWFKTYGDPTPLNTNGSISKEGEGTSTEVIHMKIGDFSDPYGVPRYVGTLIKILGARKADELNYNYFMNGRHTPLAIVLENAQLTAESEQTLQGYADGLSGENSQHKFLLLEAEKVASDDDMFNEGKDKPALKIEKLADILQKDALFLEYDQRTTEAVLSSFRLPPIYVGMSKDYNRATVETAKELTEEQVFQPRREGYEWRLNDLFTEYEFKHVELYLKSPNLSNMEDIKSILEPAIAANAVAPNDLRDLLSKILNKPLALFKGDKYNFPIGSARNQSTELTLEKAYGDNSDSEMAGMFRRMIRKFKG